MRNWITIRTSPKMKEVLDEFNQSLSDNKGMRVLRYESDNHLADLCRINILQNQMNNAIIRKARGGRRNSEIIFKL